MWICFYVSQREFRKNSKSCHPLSPIPNRRMKNQDTTKVEEKLNFDAYRVTQREAAELFTHVIRWSTGVSRAEVAIK